jgi:hypothetical protein
MPRSASSRVNPIPVVAGPPSLVCAVLTCRDADIRPGINDGSIPIFRKGLRRWIITDDAVAYIRKFPRVTRRSRKNAR